MSSGSESELDHARDRKDSIIATKRADEKRRKREQKKKTKGSQDSDLQEEQSSVEQDDVSVPPTDKRIAPASLCTPTTPQHVEMSCTPSLPEVKYRQPSLQARLLRFSKLLKFFIVILVKIVTLGLASFGTEQEERLLFEVETIDEEGRIVPSRKEYLPLGLTSTPPPTPAFKRGYSIRTMTTIQKRAEILIDSLRVRRGILERMYLDFVDELAKGLVAHKKDPDRWHPEWSDFMSLDCCLDSVPTGSEKGIFYAVDFGGTNVRAVRVKMDGHKNFEMTQLQDSIRDEGRSEHLVNGVLDKHATATMLFDAVAKRVNDLMIEDGDKYKLKPPMKVPLGFTFSFGIKQPSLDVAILEMWSKDFATGTASNDPVVGRDVAALLNSAFDRIGVPAKVNAVLNDTTGTMIAAGMERPPHLPLCVIGLILGTGVNGCYVDEDAPNFGYKGTVINTELGGFNRSLPTTILDVELDFNSANRGRQPFEKMISGLYLAEMCRLGIVRVFQHLSPPKAWEQWVIPTADLAGVFSVDTDGVEETFSLLRKYLDWEPSKDHCLIVKKIIDAVFTRAAELAAVAVAAMSKKTRRLQPAMGGLTVGVDGSLFTKNPKFRQVMRNTLDSILGHDISSLVYFHMTSDGSGKGAAMLAATVASRGK